MNPYNVLLRPVVSNDNDGAGDYPDNLDEEENEEEILTPEEETEEDLDTAGNYE